MAQEVLVEIDGHGDRPRMGVAGISPFRDLGARSGLCVLYLALGLKDHVGDGGLGYLRFLGRL